MAKTKTIKDLDVANVKKAIELGGGGAEGQKVVTDKLEAGGVNLTPSTNVNKTTGPAPINVPSITPEGEPGFVDTTGKGAPGTVSSAANVEGDITVDTTAGDKPVEGEKAPTDLIAQQEAALKATREKEDTLAADAAAVEAENLKIKTEREKEAEDFAAKQEVLIKEKEDELAKVQESIDTAAEKAKQDELDLLRQEQIDAERLSAATSELQRQKDEDAIDAAKKQVDVDRQMSAIAFQKLGLGFSSGIILNSQQIATNATVAIAGLRIQANFNETKAAVDLNAISLEFSRSINSTIDKYTTIQLKNKADIANRINETKNNLLLNNKEKEDAINALEDTYLADKRANEDKLSAEEERLADKAITQTRQIELDYEAEKNKNLIKLSDEILNGNTANMTSSEIVEKEKALGLAPGTINQKTTSLISSSIRSMFDVAVGKDVLVGDMGALTAEVTLLTKQGKTLQEAVQIVGAKAIKNTAEYKSLEAEKAAKAAAAIAKTTGTGAGEGMIDAEKNNAYGPNLTWENYKKLNPGEGSQVSRKDFLAADEAGRKLLLEGATIEKIERQDVPKIKKATPLLNKSLEKFSENVSDKAAAKSAYNELVATGYSKEEALRTLAGQNDNVDFNISADGTMRLLETDYINSTLIKE